MALDIVLCSALGNAASVGIPIRGPVCLHVTGTTPTTATLQTSNDTTDGSNGTWVNWPGGTFTANQSGFRVDAPRASWPNSGLWFRVQNTAGWATISVSAGLVDT